MNNSISVSFVVMEGGCEDEDEADSRCLLKISAGWCIFKNLG